ncbi:uncharacterized protein LOC143820064 isoform X5 [Paroedura picta]|uniref:uncharacterized protein LOC143820064 isoform X5 n=1 Tax=Paroedura picta TaxID=143630 RepID=UPI0040567A70
MGPAGPREAASKLPGDSNKFRQTEETFPGRLWHESLAPLPSSGRSRGSNIPTLELLARGEPVGAGLHARNVTNGCQESALSREAEPDRERGFPGSEHESSLEADVQKCPRGLRTSPARSGT